MTPRVASRKLRAVEAPDPDCLRCKNYFVTYEASWPHGCRVFEFKSKQLPAGLVRESSGRPCKAFAARPGPTDDGEPA